MISFLEKIVRIIDGLSDKIGHLVGWMTTLMVLVVFYDTVMRYAFNKGNVALQELEWHLFAIVFLIGAAYTLKEGGHVRVDILYVNLSKKTRAWIDFLGVFLFLIPFSVAIILATKGFILNSWAVREVSPDPGGLPARYILKTMIPLGFSLLIVQGLSEAAKNLMVIMGYTPKGRLNLKGTRNLKVTSKRQGDKS
ncbi:TRAP transporter small permease subunit [Desulfobacula sp.]|uniref:TRAP transporter small permease subunit n=1 Tax=Desulfobacula sp. TaxID=2593537 RepID=UPI00261A4DB0|nr:TRAP transporter small permease subunit [Desulfobacula sp.]